MKGPDAETYECAGFSHVPGGGRCRLHRRLAQGELSLQSIGGGAYGEKWCIPGKNSIHFYRIAISEAHRFGMCREGTLFPVHLQRRFQPNCIPLATIEGIQTLVDCLQKCMDKRGCQVVFLRNFLFKTCEFRAFPSMHLPSVVFFTGNLRFRALLNQRIRAGLWPRMDAQIGRDPLEWWTMRKESWPGMRLCQKGNQIMEELMDKPMLSVAMGV